MFNLYVQEAIDRVREDTHLGVNINGEKVDMLSFADDIAVTAESNEDLQKILDTMEQIMKNEFNMKIN